MSSHFSVLSQINVYPVKSLSGIALSTTWVEKQGLTFDRRFMLALENGRMVTARQYPNMVKVTTTLLADGLMVSYPGLNSLRICYADFKKQSTPASVWDDDFMAYTTTDEANEWFSRVVGQPVELLYTGEQSGRVREKLGHNVSFADGYPVLMISQASLDELNRRSPELHSMEQFRTNLVVSGDEPFIEDSWKKIRIGEVEFEIVKPCERCILTTVDVESGKFRSTKEPLNTLQQFRANDDGAVFFGQNLIAKNEGIIKAGDQIVVLESKEKDHYIDSWIDDDELILTEDLNDLPDVIDEPEVKTVKIRIDGHTFSGDNQTTLLEQAELAGVPLANSCRSGICGACKVTVESGKVKQESAPALKENEQYLGKALACCCVPETDVEIRS
ncbi:(2Fe-2S)-binding protein [Vibrio sp. 10N.286.49.B3]|uniref:YcbX family protein n=1 Tax=Vibrio sp. 10N.286.49.B3 TaxID=1880855 RepID=UPI000C850A95|nr:YcbX family protein [Vibrio sp. 10N.286.49.B3]PMH43181.1 (2Fe-2S)-binding protein [Vibrio sp. 10N.286.49.B3]